MPNWCHCRLVVSGQPADVLRFTEDVEGPPLDGEREPQLLSFEQHLPTPVELLDSDRRPPNGQLPEWRNWRTANWGTKWDVQDAERELTADRTRVTYRFCTAWSSPGKWIEHVSATAFPALRFECEYVSEFAEGAGRLVTVGGIETHEPLNPFALTWVEWEHDEE